MIKTMPKLFEVIIEHEAEDKKIETIRRYVTQAGDSLVRVAEHFEAHCEQYEEELISVRYMCTIVQNIE